MKHPWVAYLIVALLAIIAAVVIAGLPDDSPAATTITQSTATIETAPTSEPVTTDSATTAPSETSTPSDTSPDSTESTTTTQSTTTTLPATATTEVELPPRSDFFTIVANGANVAGAAARNIERLRPLGYTDIAGRNGTLVSDFTVVYHADGLEQAASRLAVDLELFPDFIAPLLDAPQVIDLPDDVQLLAYIGLDRAS
jgi:hypothetical protein